MEFEGLLKKRIIMKLYDLGITIVLGMAVIGLVVMGLMGK